MCTPPREASSVGCKRSGSISKGLRHASRVKKVTAAGDARLQQIWVELKAANPDLRTAHYNVELLAAAEAAVNQGLGKERSGDLPAAERLALRALLPAGGRVAQLRVWTSYLHALEADRAAAATLAEQVAKSAATASLGPRMSAPSAQSAALPAFRWSFGSPASTLGPPRPHPVVWDLVPKRAIGAGVSSPAVFLSTMRQVAPCAKFCDMDSRKSTPRPPRLASYVRVQVKAEAEARAMCERVLGVRGGRSNF